MTQVLPFRAFKCPEGKVPLPGDNQSLAVSLLTSPGVDADRSIPDGAIPLFGESGPGGFLVFRHDYTASSGVRKSRLALVALLRPVDGGTVKPALDVDPREVASLLTELERARTQLEPVIGIYDDVRLELDKILERACLVGGKPELDDEGPEGDHLRLWKIASQPIIDEITRFFDGRDLYVLDGLPVSRAYRRLNGGTECRDADDRNGSPAGCPLTVFANLCDFGVELTAHHPLVKDLPPIKINELVLRLTPFFHVSSFPFSGAHERSAVIRRFRDSFRVLAYTDNAIGAYFGGNSQLFLFRLREDVDRDRLFLPDVRREQQNLDAFLLRHVILERYVWADAGVATADRILDYARTIEEAVHSVDSGRCCAAFLLNPPTKRQLTEFLREGLRLPPGAVALNPPVPSGLIAHFL